MGLLALWDSVFSRVRANEKAHLAWCCTGVIGCLVAYGVLQARSKFKGPESWPPHRPAPRCARPTNALGRRKQRGRHAGSREGARPARRHSTARPPLARFACATLLAPPAGADHAGQLWRRDLHLLALPGAVQPRDHNDRGAHHAAGGCCRQGPASACRGSSSCWPANPARCLALTRLQP
jgi:hypothetical protein